MKYLHCSAILGSFMATIFCQPLQAATPTLTASQAIASIEQTRRFPQTKVSTCALLPKVLHFGRSDLKYVDGDLTISGIDESGHAYTAVKGISISGCEIWSADLDGSGTPDLEVLTEGTDSSGGYDSELSLILFAANGQPTPWKAVGRFTADEKGVKQIVGDSSKNHASIIVPTKEGLTGPDANFAYQLYSFGTFSVSKTVGDALGLAWPVFQNSTPALIKHQEASSLSYDLKADKRTARLMSSNTPSVQATSMLALDNGQQVEPPAVVVQDAADGSRNINFDPIPPDITKLLSQHAQIKTMGRSCEEEECRPFILIAKP